MSQKKIPRPRNAFILFRQHHHRLLIEEWTSQGVDVPHNSKISKILGTRWKALGEAERSHWEQLARQEKCEHEKKYPDYRYKPIRRHKRRGSRVDEEHLHRQAATSEAASPVSAAAAAVAAAAPRALHHQLLQQGGLPAFPASAPPIAAPAAFASRPAAAGAVPLGLGAPYHHHHQPYYLQSYLPRISGAVPTVPPPGVLPSVYAPMPSTPGVPRMPGASWQWQPSYCYPFDHRGRR